MRVDVVFYADSANPDAVREQTVVIIDVLRASTSIAVALEAGATSVQPVLQVDEARSLRDAWQEQGRAVLLAGERQGVPIAGFDLGNSPQELLAADLATRQLILTTSNGTKAALSSANAAHCLVGSFVNLAAVARVVHDIGRDLVLLCAGTSLGTAFSLEDSIAAGSIVRALQRLTPSLEVTDAALLARLAAEQVPENKGDIIAFLRNVRHGAYLESLGAGHDLTICGALNSVKTVPVLRDGAFVAWP